MAIYVVENNLIMKVDQFSSLSFGLSENQYIFNVNKLVFLSDLSKMSMARLLVIHSIWQIFAITN